MRLCRKNDQSLSKHLARLWGIAEAIQMIFCPDLGCLYLLFNSILLEIVVHQTENAFISRTH